MFQDEEEKFVALVEIMYMQNLVYQQHIHHLSNFIIEVIQFMNKTSLNNFFLFTHFVDFLLFNKIIIF